jgi:hypothetical protein
VPVRIPLWPAIELQSSMSFSNLAVPVAADTAHIQVRFRRRTGSTCHRPSRSAACSAR